MTEESTRERQRRLRIRQLAGITSAVTVLVTWYLATIQFNLIPSLFFPSPLDVLDTLIRVRSTILQHSIVTLVRILSSFVLGSAIGIFVGLIMSRYNIIYGLLNPIIEALRPIPPIALIPFFILWFGIGNFGKVLLTGIGCFMVMVVNTIEAVRNVPRIYLQAAQSLGAEEGYVYRTVILPAILPELIAGFRVGLALNAGTQHHKSLPMVPGS